LRSRAVEAQLVAARRAQARAPVHDPADRASVERARSRHSELLDREALSGSGSAARRDRDYAPLAPLIALSAGEYDTASAAERRRANAAIDRELDRRRRWLQGEVDVPPALVFDNAPAAPPKAPQPRTAVSRRERQFKPGLR
jgi:hypothetical protein